LSFVVDASVVFAWQFPDEETSRVEDVVETFLDRGAAVPVHWCAEISSGFAVAVRRGRMAADFRDGALARLPSLPIEVDEESAMAFFGATQIYCDRHGLSAYDAAYIELAARRGLSLATLDIRLANAARKEGVAVLGPLA
jgi:predicted nucleic acid-binding protein